MSAISKMNSYKYSFPLGEFMLGQTLVNIHLWHVPVVIYSESSALKQSMENLYIQWCLILNSPFRLKKK